MRILVPMMLMIFSAVGFAGAATLNLNDGRVVQGDIVKQDDKSVEVSVDGTTLTYYKDEIKDIDGKPLEAQEAAPVGDQTAPEPAAAAPEAAAPEAAAPEAAAPEAAAPEAAAPQAVAQNESAPAIPSAPVGASSAGSVDPEKKALILKFIDVFGTRQALINNFETMISQLEKKEPGEADKIRQRVKVDEIIERLIPIYDRNFSTEDLKSFISFYGSSEGQKLISTIPELMKESVQESIKYMQEKFPEIKS